MTSELSTLGEPVKVGSISFQTIISSSILPMPEKRLDLTTSFQIGMKITNNSQKDYYFIRMQRNLIVQHKVYDHSYHCEAIIRTDRNEYNYVYDYNSWLYLFPRSDDVVLAESGKSTNLMFQGVIGWQKSHKKTRQRKKKNIEKTSMLENYVAGEENDYKLVVYLVFKDNHFFLRPVSKETHSYKIGCEYRMIEILRSSKENYHNSYFAHIIPNLDQIWVGIVHTPFIEFQIVEG